MLDSARDRLLAAEDTIVAIATPEGRSGIGVVRVSGPGARAIVEGCFDSADGYLPRFARFGTFRPKGGGAPIDQVVVTVFEGPRSYTGEDVAEISAHGNPLILKAIESVVLSGGARRARPGEFTLRAVSNGKLDLAQAEAVRDFVAAVTFDQARTAFRQIEGSVSGKVRREMDLLRGWIAELEAGIDFADDEVEPADRAGVAARLESLSDELVRMAGSFDYGRLLSGGLTIAVVGRPNVGKSSLFNRLVADDRAIVTEIPGTTRDVLTETIAVSGVPVRVADTAGVRRTDDPIETLGVRRALETSVDADLALLVLDGSEALTEADHSLLDRLSGAPAVLVAINKSDLPPAWDPSPVTPNAIRVSALTGAGCAALESSIAHWIGERRPAQSDGLVVTSLRQQEALEAAARGAAKAGRALAGGVPDEMVLVDLYGALAALGEITGEITNEDILNQIFSTFCIGK